MSWFFSSKKSLLSSGLLSGVTDIHSHILPGVDDGVLNIGEALEALSYLQKIGVVHLYLTPHIMDVVIDYEEIFRQKFEELLLLSPKGIEIRMAAEYMLDGGFSAHLEKGLHTIGGRHVLVETSYLADPVQMEPLLCEIALAGYTPVIAHPERYMYMNENLCASMRTKGYEFQLNLLSLSTFYGKRTMDVAENFLHKGYYSYIGSDIHRLENFQRVVDSVYLSRRQETDIKQLLENNNRLW